MNSKLWRGIQPDARDLIHTRNYTAPTLEDKLKNTGIKVDELINNMDKLKNVWINAWIPGVEIIRRVVHQQQGRGYFSELTRISEGRLHEIGLEPQQWASTLIHRDSVKGFHIHPPFIPIGIEPIRWFNKQFVVESDAYEQRLYQLEQWDVMFFLTGICEIILVDEREGLKRNIMRFTIHGDSKPGSNNAYIVIPPGVAHALRSVGAEDIVMVYGTSTVFDPHNEGRIVSDIEDSKLPTDWDDYLNLSS